MTLKLKLQAAARLKAHDFGDTPPKTWTQGDVDLTFAPFCKVVRAHLGHEVQGIAGSKDQQWLWVYLDQVKSKDIPIVDKALKAAQIPGSPRFNSINLANHSSYQGLFVIKYRIY